MEGGDEMKVSEIKGKVAAKVAKGKAKVADKCGKCGKAAKACAVIALLVALVGCHMGEQPTAQRAQTSTIRDNVFRSFGHGALEVSGGDRRNLVHSGNVISNNDFSDIENRRRTYAPHLHLAGVGAEVSYNHFHNSPSSAMRLEGNDFLIVSNLVEDVLLESDDQGGVDIYFNASYFGNRYCYNTWKNIGRQTDKLPCGQAAVRFDGNISGLTDWGMYVEIDPTKIEGMVPLRDIKSDFFEFDEDNYCLRGRRTRKVYRLGDPVRIRVKATNLEQRLLDYELIESEIENAPAPESRKKRGSDKRSSDKRSSSKKPAKTSKPSKTRKSR